MSSLIVVKRNIEVNTCKFICCKKEKIVIYYYTFTCDLSCVRMVGVNVVHKCYRMCVYVYA